MRPALAALLLSLGASPAVAAADWIDGEWCDPKQEERLFIAGDDLGFNEHTICEWAHGRPAGDVFEADMLCANVYPNGDEVVRMDERTVRLSGDARDPASLLVILEGEAPVTFTRCDG